jgi:tetratricopeptide (TPR) repeat protein
MRAIVSRKRGLASIAALLLLAGGAAGLAEAGQAPGPAPKVRLALLPFTGAAKEGSEGLDAALSQALREALGEVRAVRVVEAGPLLAAVARRQVTLSDQVPVATLEALGRDLKVRAVMAGSFSLDGDTLTVQVQVVDLAGKGGRVTEEHSGPLAAFEAGQAALARRLLAALGVKESEHDARRLQAAQGRPPVSLAAYAPYALARWQQALGTREGHEQALSLLGKALDADQNFARAHFAQGVSLTATNNRWKASSALRKALQLDPTFAEAYRWLGDLLVRSPRRLYDQAIQAYEKALEQSPDMAEAYVGLGEARQAKGQFDEALRDYKRALAVEPENARVHFGMGRIYYQEKQQYHEAVAEYQKAIQLEPGFLDAHMSLGDLYEEKGLYPDAIARYQHVLGLEPNHPGATFGLARTYESVDPVKAITHWEKYIELASELPSEKEWVEIANRHLNKLRRETGK